jgi:hypothetical protein
MSWFRVIVRGRWLLMSPQLGPKGRLAMRCLEQAKALEEFGASAMFNEGRVVGGLQRTVTLSAVSLHTLTHIVFTTGSLIVRKA